LWWCCRDEEKARAKERIFSVRDDFGQWDENQRPELFDLLNGKIENGQTYVFFLFQTGQN
jgi:sulfate adenylyltransferase subunit 2